MNKEIKNYAEFDSSFPDDSVEASQGDIEVPDGRQLAHAIYSNLPRKQAEPKQHSFYGWTFSFSPDEQHTANVLIQCPEPWLLIVEIKTGLFCSKSRKKIFYAKTIEQVDMAMKQSAEITNIHWMSVLEYKAR